MYEGGCQYMNKSQYNTPSMEVIELGDKDIVCASPGQNWEVGPGGSAGGGGIGTEKPGELPAEITG